MQISSKHQNQSTTTLQSFVGGLNTSSPDELIAENQLAECINMEINGAGLLRTVKGTRDIIVPQNLQADLKAGAFDDINGVLLVFDKEGTTYTLVDGELKEVGTLSGDDEVICQPWEDGILIASGGLLQYAKPVPLNDLTMGEENEEYKLTTIPTSPADSGGVYVRSGRVFVFDSEDNLKYSGVGDEEMWVQDTNDPSTALFTQIGYKVGGRIIGLVNMQSYVLIIKDNGKIYRLDNEYPDWSIQEVTSNGLCKGKLAYASIGGGVFVLGEKTMQLISPTDQNGNMPINYVGKQVENEIANLPPHTKMRYNTDLNQLWFITGSQWVLVYDCNTQTFFQRYFNADVVDMVGNFIIKKDRISELSDMEEVMEDNGEPLYYRAKFKTEMGLQDILVKHVDLSLNPLVSFYEDAQATLKVSRINVSFPQRNRSIDNRIQRTVGVTNKAVEPARTTIGGVRDEADTKWVNTIAGSGYDDVAFNRENISAGKSLLYKKRQICRGHKVDVELEGRGFPFILNFISYDKVVV